MADQALHHLRVVELSDRVAGSFCAKLLADLGADVIKVEPPLRGDPIRWAGPFKGDHVDSAAGGLHLFLNTNKRSVTLDPATATGAVILRQLLSDADALVSTVDGDAWTSWGLALDELEELNPRLIVTLVTDFGLYGPYKDYKGADLVHWAIGSLLFHSGLPGREPIRIGDDVSEYVAGLNAAASTLGALYGRDSTGAQRIDVSILESLMTILPSTALGYSYTKVLAPRAGNRFPNTIVQCKDGYLGFYTMLQHQWEHLSVLVDMVHLQEDERFATPIARFRHPEGIMEVLAPWFRERNADQVVEAAQELRIPMVKVASAQDVLRNPQFNARDFFTDIGSPTSGAVTGPGRPFTLTQTPWRLDRPAPALGEHNMQVYCGGLGFTREELALLVAQDVV
jgi:crotonobetainyl-CoA:carnitine CoA-transferase CaiB-like acyl-CoA transferase